MNVEKLKQKTYNLLRKSEKYFKTDMVYLFKNGAWLTLGQAISSISSFLLAIAFANLLPKETYGNYKFILSVAGILSIPTLSGMNTAVAQAVARGYEGSINIALKTKIYWGFWGSLASLILSGYYYSNGNNTLTISFLVISIFIPFLDSFNLYGALLNGKKLFKHSTKFNIISQSIAVISIVTTIFFTNNLFIILLAYFIPWTILRYVFFKITLKKFSPNKKTDHKTIDYGKHLSVINILPLIAQHIDKILVFHYLGATDLAIYAFAIAIPEQIKGFIKNIALLAFPKFANQDIDEIKNNIVEKMLKFGIIITIFIVIYILSAPYIYNILFPNYSASIIYSQLFSISLLAATAMLPISALQAKAKIRKLYNFNTYSSLVQILTLFIFIYFYGLMGIIVARIITRFINLGLSLFLIKKN